MQMKPVPHPTGPLMQPKGPPPFQDPGTPQFPPRPQSPPCPQSPPSPSWFPWGLSCGNGIPATPGDGGLAFATPAPSPNAVNPSAPTMAASAKILVSFIVQPLFTTPHVATRPSLVQPLARQPHAVHPARHPPFSSVALAHARCGNVVGTPSDQSLRLAQAWFSSSAQLAATFLLGCTRGGSPGIFG